MSAPSSANAALRPAGISGIRASAAAAWAGPLLLFLTFSLLALPWRWSLVQSEVQRRLPYALARRLMMSVSR